jgi:Cu(I)/Ag(I) efflux system membrane protein CusA/SilA
MILRVISLCARHPLLVLLATLLLALGGVFAQRSLPRDAIPDLSDPQIVLVADWMGHPASEVATEVTDVLTKALEDVPGSTAIRGSSMTGMAYVDIVFDSVSALPAGRAEILSRVRRMRAKLPPNVDVQVGPEASSTGWVYQYVLMPPEKSGVMSMAESKHDAAARALRPLRAFQDRVLRPQLSQVPGVGEVASLGGETDEVLVETTPDRLRGASSSLSDVVSAVTNKLRLEPHSTVKQVQDLALPANKDGPGATLETVARVRVLPQMASGMADVDGATHAIGGIIVAKRGADVRQVISGVKAVIDRERHKLPYGARLGVVYDRSELANGVERTLLRAVAEEVGVVVLVVLLFLLHARSALVPMITLPLVVLLTFASMRFLGVPATVMSLGGIAIALGLAVDAELVALEACHRQLEADGSASKGPERRKRILAAASTFAPAILTSLMIAAFAFIPVFAFGGETGRLLRPLAVTKTVVIVAAALVALTVAPALRDRLLRGRVVPELRNPLTRGLIRVYRPFVNFALARPAFTLATAALAALSCVPILSRLGTEFLPRIDEGLLLFMPTTAAGLPPSEAAANLKRQDLDIVAHKEVALVFGKIGRAETATDPAPFSMAETTIRLKPRSEWPKVARHRWYSNWAPAPVKRVLGLVWPEQSPETTAELVEHLDRATQFPGWTNAWTAPVRARMDMMSTGVRTPVGVRIFANDPARLDALGAAVQAAAQRVAGTKSAVYEALGGEVRPVFHADSAAMARHDVDPALVASTANLLLTGGQLGEMDRAAANTTDGRSDDRPLRVRLSLSAPWLPDTPADLLREASVRAGKDHAGQPIPLGLLGRPVFENVPASLRSEHGERCAYVHIDLADGTDLSGYVELARSEVEHALGTESRLGWRPGERIEWTGQYQLLSAGQRRLKLIAPLVALCMLGLLFLQFKSVAKALIVFASVPFALVGSFWTLYLLDYRLSAPVWVGLLSVVGLAMQTGVLMVVYIDDAFQRRMNEGRMRTREDVIAAHAEGTIQRLRPKVMTIATMGACLLPLLWGQGAGSEIMRRIAAPMIGGLVTSAFLTLEVLPVLYTIWRTYQLEAARAPVEAEASDVPA